MAGSATPRPESMLRYERIALPERVDGRGLPPVELVGMAGHGRAAPRAHARGARRGAPPRGEGDRAAEPARLVELPLVPRAARASGSARTATSRSCSTARLGERGLPPLRPPRAGPARVPRLRRRCRWPATAPGTEQLERELEELVAPLPVFRLDSDVAAAAGVAAVLRRFDEAPAGVLVGTQMVAKGHDFPDVTLGVVLDADATLRFPDFRAEERTFALVAQLAGPQRPGRARRPRDRAGARPGGRGARASPRATTPTASSRRELARRELLGYPPHGHLIRVVCSSAEPGPGARRGRGDPRAHRGRGRAGARPGAAVPPPGAPPRPARDPLAATAPRRSPPCARPWRRWPRDRAHAGASFAVDVDPQ